MILLEDIAYFSFHPDKTLEEDSWVNFGLGGFRIIGKWIPWTYIILVGLFALIYKVIG